MYEFIGTVKRIGETRTFASGFATRELVVIEERPAQFSGTEWQNIVAFVFKRANGQLLDPIHIGERVKIGFVVDGREWTNPQTQELRCFSNLTALRLEKLATPSSADAATIPTGGCASTSACARSAAPTPSASADDEEAYPF